MEDLAMDVAREACTAALATRSARKIRVRQPLREMKIVSRSISGFGEFDAISELIKDEVNVQSVVWEQDVEAYAITRLHINSQILGKRLPEKMKQILPASKKGEWKKLADGSVEIAGEKLLDGEYSILLEPKTEYKECAAPLSSNDALVVLDLTITPELEAEGLARDLVRMIQQARKDAGLNVSDRIALVLDLPESMRPAMQHQNYIEEQTLAVSIAESGAETCEKISTQEIDGEKITIGITKAA
jgi:isoleucyl-tRNA synthetase